MWHGLSENFMKRINKIPSLLRLILVACYSSFIVLFDLQKIGKILYSHQILKASSTVRLACHHRKRLQLKVRGRTSKNTPCKLVLNTRTYLAGHVFPRFYNCERMRHSEFYIWYGEQSSASLTTTSDILQSTSVFDRSFGGEHCIDKLSLHKLKNLFLISERLI